VYLCEPTVFGRKLKPRINRAQDSLNRALKRIEVTIRDQLSSHSPRVFWRGNSPSSPNLREEGIGLPDLVRKPLSSSSAPVSVSASIASTSPLRV